MHSVAAEIAEEVVVLFENSDLYTVASKQVTQHHAHRPTSDYAAGCFQHVISHKRSVCLSFFLKDYIVRCGSVRSRIRRDGPQKSLRYTRNR
jgi:hypothetical protein